MKITVYEKTMMHCGACTAMMAAYDEWTNTLDGDIPGYVSYSAEENADLLREMGQQQAPVWIIDAEDGSVPKVVGGHRTDDLKEALDAGMIDIWE